MALHPSAFGTLSRLFDQLMAVDAGAREAWFEALPATQRALAPALRAMLAEAGSPAHAAFLADGPRLRAATPDDPGVRAGDVLGAYTLVRQLGRGGMASVWLAERLDGLVKRPAALKIPVTSLRGAARVERFERERDALARLNHPQIARLYDAGVSHTGQPYIVLEHVDGLPITQACDAQAMPLDGRLRLFLQVLEAVDHAHRHLVVHRDIKPSNVFVDGEGHVKLLDFGIAKLMTEASGDQAASALTLEAGCALTPSHAAPEQLDGRPVSTATDVHGLGLLLYELLCGRLPHPEAKASMAQALHAGLHLLPPPPSQAVAGAEAARRRGLADGAALRARLAGDLDTITLKALQKQPSDRYSSVERLADDIRRYLGHRPIRARRPALWRRAQLLVQRHRAASAAVALGLAAGCGLSGLAWQQHRQTVEQEARSVAVRDFMFDLVDDAEADEQHPGAEPSGRAMVAGAVRRARASFTQQPRLQGELLAELGRMQARLGEDEASVRLLQDALALLQAHAPDGDASLNKARAHLAAARLDQGQVHEADALAGTALAACRRSDDCAKARYYAQAVLCSVALRRGQAAPALQHMRDGVAESERGFGPQHAETARALQALAVVARQASQYSLALQTIDRALAISQHLTLRQADRVELLRTRAVLSYDLGEFADAQHRLDALLAQAGAPAERALLWRLLANVQLALGHAAPARDAAAQALSLADADKPDAEALFAHQAHARALALLGQGEAASAEMRAVVAGLQAAGYAPRAMETLRARRVQAEVQWRAGRQAEALAQLRALRDEQAQAAPGQEVEFAQTLDLLGSLLQQGGDAHAALQAHRQAAALLTAKLPAGHPLLTGNARLQQVAERSLL